MTDITANRNLNQPVAMLKWLPAIVVLIFGATLHASMLQSKRYVIIVANNNSLDEGVAPLQYADDDGARYFELFSGSGADTILLTVPDSNTQSKFPNAVEHAAPPTHQKLTERLSAVFSKIAADNANGIETHFTFVYAGHGNMGPNREGYINLLDQKLSRKAFFAEVVAASPATFNHIILDACHSYYLVNKRGAGSSHRTGDYRQDIRDFLAAELLSHYPNTGVILAASQDSETHEWHRLESGIFSHEIISALLGTADVNEDGIVTYQEAAACVEAANIGIPIQRAKLNVYFRPPTGRENLPLMDLSTFKNVATLRLDKEMGGRYFLEDARGIRTADLNFTKEQAVQVKLIGQAPFYLRTDNTEARIEPLDGVAKSKLLVFNSLQENHRGSIEQSFRKHLFEIPFGRSFYLGMFAAAGRAAEGPRVSGPPEIKPRVTADTQRTEPNANRILGWTFLGTGVAAGIASGVLYGAAKSSHADYKSATEPTVIKAQRETTEQRMRLSRAFMGTAVGLGIAGASLLIVQAVQNKPARKTTAHRKQIMPNLTVDAGQGTVGISGEF